LDAVVGREQLQRVQEIQHPQPVLHFSPANTSRPMRLTAVTQMACSMLTLRPS
jgi:hypothetical protein